MLRTFENNSILCSGVVGRDLTAARQDYPGLWDCDDQPEGNRESQIPMRHGQAVKTALKKLATFQTLQRIDRAFDATDGSVFRQGLWDHLGSISRMVPLCLFAPNSPCSETTLVSKKRVKSPSKHHQNKISRILRGRNV